MIVYCVDGGLFCRLFVLVMVGVWLSGWGVCGWCTWVLCCLLRVFRALVVCGLLARVLALLRVRL